jgi:hypothetical protein
VLRIREDMLESNRGLLFSAGTAFTGVVYQIGGPWVRGNSLVVDGVPGLAYEPWDPNVPRAVLSELTIIDERKVSERFPTVGYYMGTAPFRGLAYDFAEPTGLLLSEREVSEKGPGAGRDWYPSGELQCQETYNRELDEWNLERWHENGKRACLVLGNRLRVFLTEPGRLESLTLIPPIPPGVLRPPFRVGTVLGLCGAGITDETLDWLLDLHRVRSLSVHATSLTKEGLSKFSVCTELRILTTGENEQLQIDAIRRFVAAKNCDWHNDDMDG